MAASVSFLDDDAFIQSLEIEMNKKLSVEEVNKQKGKNLAFTNGSKSAIYVNLTLLNKDVQRIYTLQPEIAKELGEKDPIIVIIKSLLMHEFVQQSDLLHCRN